MSKTAVNISAKDRVNEFGSDKFHCDGGILFCSSCNKAVDHIRRQTIVDHLASAKHKNAQMRKAESDSGVPSKKQCTVTGLFQRQSMAKEHRDTVIQDFVKMLVQANIPLEKADHPAVQNFLSTHVRDGGAIPKASTLREVYLPVLFQEHESKLHSLVNGNSYICIIADETTDVQNRPVLNILFQLLSPIDELSSEIDELPTPLLMQTAYIDTVNHATVSHAIIQCCSNFQIDFSKILLFVSDSASYMMKAWNTILSSIFMNCHHMSCHAHILALAGNSLRLALADVDRCVALLKSVLIKAPSRRNRFLRHLQSQGVISPSLPPEPIITRWNTWFKTVTYHAPLLHHYPLFIHTEREEESDSAALKELSNLLQSDNLREHFSFVATNCHRLITTLDTLQSRKPQIHDAYNTLVDLVSWLDQLAASTTDESCILAVGAASKKLKEYLKDNKQQSVRLLKAIRCLDPIQLPSLDVSSYPTLKADLHLPENCEGEWAIYLGLAGDIGQSKPKPISFWKAVYQRVPRLATHAVLLLQLPVNSADVERSFSKYNQIFTAQRQRLNTDNVAGLLKLHYNRI